MVGNGRRSPRPGGEPSAQDIETMTQNMAESIQRLEFKQPFPKLIVMKWVKNETSTIRYMNRITLARIRVLLQKHVSRKALVFLLENEDLTDLVIEEGALGPGEQLEDARVKPEYALMGAVYDHPDKKGTYYLYTFQLAHLKTGVIQWEDSYEVRCGVYCR